jgi:hypothetical protein
MKTTISLPADTFERVDRAAKQLGFSRSEFFARAAERWLAVLEDDQTTAAIDRAPARHSLRGRGRGRRRAAILCRSTLRRACTRPRRDPRHPPLHAPSVTTAPVLLDASAV